MNTQGASRELQILIVCKFNSMRKRMLTVVRTPEGKIELCWEGADTGATSPGGVSFIFVVFLFAVT